MPGCSKMLKKCEEISRSEAVLGAVLDVPNDTKSYYNV